MTLGASFQIGRSALAAYQAAIAISGQNIANVGNVNYTRQSGRLSALFGGTLIGGVKPGSGVRIDALQRHFDSAIEDRLRVSLGGRSASQTVYDNLSRVESLYNELTDQDLSTRLGELFSAFGGLQAEPSESTARDNIIAAADSLINTIRRQREGLLDQIDGLNEQAGVAARRVGEIANEIGRLNEMIVREEADGRTLASPLRDNRDALLRDLAELVNVTVREQPNGTVNVYTGSDPLVEFNRVRQFTSEIERVDGIEIVQIRYADDGSIVRIGEGEFGGILTARDTHLRDQLEKLDELTAGIIYEVNKIHSTGVGTVGYSTMASAYAVSDPDVALSNANLPFPLNNGSFIVNVRDKATGQVITRQIDVDLDGLNGDDTTLNDLAAALDAVPGLNASVGADNLIRISGDTGNEFWFSEDSSSALAALGLGGLFTGQTASDIEVNSLVRNDPRLIASSLTGAEGDGDNAGLLSKLADPSKVSVMLGNRTIQDFQRLIVTDLAVETASAQAAYDANDSTYQALIAQREAISGVSLDEEALNLARFEQAYQGAARYLSTVNQLSDEILALL
ncbi:MAG: flagellar hook-associated protein FlgK [Phycisphaerales bacterium]|nr:flagellar hook-associated protein FlgK [Phycisphaerales bacterium]